MLLLTFSGLNQTVKGIESYWVDYIYSSSSAVERPTYNRLMMVQVHPTVPHSIF